jgi:hypothetical protein
MCALPHMRMGAAGRRAWQDRGALMYDPTEALPLIA